MKAIIKCVSFVFIGIIILTSCKKYLDKTPGAGLSYDEVFSKYENFNMFFQTIYSGDPFNITFAHARYIETAAGKNHWDGVGPCTVVDFARGNRSRDGVAGDGWASNYAGQWKGMFVVIRTINTALENIHLVNDITQKQMDDFKAQSYFLRAYANFNVHRKYGPMPYLTKALGQEDQWDQKRLTKYDYLLKIANDLDTAANFFKKADLMRRDNPVPGNPGHLTHPDLYKPNGCAALALKGRVLLYAASPLNNGGNTGQPWEQPCGEGQKSWENAAKANWEALQVALQNGYALLSSADYKYNFEGVPYTNEQLWAYTLPATAYSHTYKNTLIAGPIARNSFFNTACPTQNAVDRFETKWGDPLDTETDRQAAIALGHYNEQDPYANREPLFYTDVIHNTLSLPGFGPAQMYYEKINGAVKYAELIAKTYAGWTRTGYYVAKQWGGESYKNNILVTTTDPIIHLAEVYLNYAEAANEAYGPNTPAPGADLSAVQAVNLIRKRFSHVPVQNRFATSKEEFRKRIMNERFVQLFFEGHWYHDIHRWMIAKVEASKVLYGIDVEKLSSGYNPAVYPTGYRYSRVPLEASRQQVWNDGMYYQPFLTTEMQKMKIFLPNTQW